MGQLCDEVACTMLTHDLGNRVQDTGGSGDGVLGFLLDGLSVGVSAIFRDSPI